MSRRGKNNSDNDSLFFDYDFETGKGGFHFGDLPYDNYYDFTKNGIHHLLNKLNYRDTAYWDDRCIYEAQEIKNVEKI